MVDQKQLHKLFQSENLSVLIKNARALISNPIILTDINYNVLEMSDEPEISDPKWLEIKSSKKLEDIKSISDVFRQSLKTSRPLLHRDINDTIDVMRMAVAHRDQLIGFLEIPCYNTIPDQEEQELIVFVADVVCLIMKRDLGYFYAPAGGKEFLFMI